MRSGDERSVAGGGPLFESKSHLMQPVFKKKVNLIGVFLVLLLLSGVALWAVLSRRPVEIVSPRVAPLIDMVYGLGTVMALRSYELRLGITNTIDRLHVREGEFVRKGAVMVRFVDGVTVRAPFAGTVTSLPFEEGENVFPQSVILTLVDLSRLYVSVAMEQRQIVRVREGQRANISLESLRNQRIVGRVRSVYPNQDQFLVWIDVPELPRGVLPGMTADAAIEVGSEERALLVPRAAVSEGAVTVIRDGERMEVPVTVGRVMTQRRTQWAEITSGNIEPEDGVVLKAGDRS